MTIVDTIDGSDYVDAACITAVSRITSDGYVPEYIAVVDMAAASLGGGLVRGKSAASSVKHSLERLVSQGYLEIDQITVIKGSPIGVLLKLTKKGESLQKTAAETSKRAEQFLARSAAEERFE
jgi:hypothetical protein